MSKKVLIITYAFPPYNTTIGARRWVKFSKYLVRNGIEVHVLTTKRSGKKSSNWVKEIEGINIHYYSNKFPVFLHRNFNAKVDFILKVIQFFLRKAVEIWYNSIWMDEAIFDEKNIVSEAGKIISKYKINNLITTGPPHRINLFGAFIKKQFPKINFIIDYRDSWFDAKNYGYENISNYLKIVELNNEKISFSLCDKILCVNEMFIEEINIRHHNKFKYKLFHIPHLIDEDDYSVSNVNPIKGNKTVLIYGGTVTNKVLNNELDSFFNNLSIYKEKTKILSEKISIIIHSSNSNIKDKVNFYDLNEIVIVKQLIHEKDFLYKLSKSDYLLSLLSNDWKDYITTKQVMYLPLRKPLILLSDYGKASDMILKNKLGLVINNDNFENVLDVILNNNLLFNNDYNYSKYTYKNRTKELIDLLY